jgi:hypothetical protein
MAAGDAPAVGAYAATLLDIPLPWTRRRQVDALLSLVKKWVRLGSISRGGSSGRGASLGPRPEGPQSRMLNPVWDSDPLRWVPTLAT